MNEYDEKIAKRMKAYRTWKKNNEFPSFEPIDGICWYCKKQIFEKEDGLKAITGCPYCNRSFVN